LASGELSSSFGSRCGFYKFRHGPSGLVFLALNTNLYYKTNHTEADVCQQESIS
jgi:hypothetical protein